MKKELQEKLYNRYPELFSQKDLSIKQSCMPFGIETGDGWYNIINSVCCLLQHYVKNSRSDRARNLIWNRRLKQAIDGNTTNLYRFFNNSIGYTEEKANEEIEKQIKNKNFRKVEKPVPQIQFTQIKEKYGTLRLYTNHVDDYIDGVVAMAEIMSGCTCEVCGVPGKLTGGGWYQTLCRRCAKQQQIPYDEKKEDDDE